MKTTMQMNRFMYDIYRKAKYIVNISLAEIIFSLKKDNYSHRYWILGLEDDIYANNGKVFYEYMIQNHKEIDIYWVCRKERKKYFEKYIPQDKLIERGTLNNYLFALGAEAAVYGFSDKDVAPGFFRLIKSHKAVLVNISHGFDGLKGMPKDYYKVIPADIICAASTYERDIKVNFCGASADRVKTTGFARYDEWKTDDTDKEIKTIFIMPTWRDWYEDENKNWKNTSIFYYYEGLMKELDKVKQDYKVDIVCKFHPRMKAFFRSTYISKKINFDSENKSIQELLKEADLVITDYSSITWDALYMNKLVLLYWFDFEEYKSKRGLMVDDKFYPYIAKSQADIVCMIKAALDKKLNHHRIAEKYFDYIDKGNCERTYKAIMEKIK